MNANRNALAALLDEVDAAGLKVTWLEVPSGGWRCVTTSIRFDRMPPHDGRGSTPLAALSDAMRFLRAIGVCR